MFHQVSVVQILRRKLGIIHYQTSKNHQQLAYYHLNQHKKSRRRSQNK